MRWRDDREPRISRTTAGVVNPLGRCWRSDQHARGSNGATHQLAAAIGASTMQDIRRTPLAKCTFERANHRFGASRRQVPVAALAVRSQLKHSAHRTRQLPGAGVCPARSGRGCGACASAVRLRSAWLVLQWRDGLRPLDSRHTKSVRTQRVRRGQLSSSPPRWASPARHFAGTSGAASERARRSFRMVPHDTGA
jgi:hypothetical protein